MIFYHGGPITPDTCARRVWRGRHAFVSFACPQQIELASTFSQSFALDNGAFTFWRQGRAVDWDDFYRWSEEWLRHPACDWAVIPDVIGGTEEENDALLEAWPHGADRGVPVWHLNEPPERLVRLAAAYRRVALGSAAEYDVSRPAACIARLNEVLPAICVDGVPVVKLHGLRMLNPPVVEAIPLSSADSTNVARNIGLDVRWAGAYAPATKETRADVLVERIEQAQAPCRLVEPVAHHFDLWTVGA